MNDQSFEVLIAEILRDRNLQIAIAESCTGGLVSNKITNIPGSSEYFVGGVIPYANQAKIDLLGVNIETLVEHGAVSRETVLEMAIGVRRVFDADIGVAISGIAGPGGGTDEKPVGTVIIGLSDRDRQYYWSHHLNGSRIQIKSQSAELALKHLHDFLVEKYPPQTVE